MPINPNIPLSVNQYQQDPLGDYSKIMTLKNLMQQQEMAPLQAQREAELFDMEKQQFGMQKDKYANDEQTAKLERLLKQHEALQKSVQNTTLENYPQSYEYHLNMYGPDIMKGAPSPDSPPDVIQNFLDITKADLGKKSEEINKMVIIGPDGKPIVNPAYIEGKRQEEEIKAKYGPDVNMPSNIQEWQYYNKLSPEERNEYLRVKRADKYLDTGGGFVVTNPARPTETSPIVDKTLNPKDQAAAEAAKLQQDYRIKSIIDTSTMLKDQATELMNHPGLDNITGWLFGRIPTVTQKGRNAQEILDTIMNKTFVNTLQNMREASKTGGAVGNVSDREGERLENAFVALGQSQDTATYKTRLQEMIDAIDLANARLEQAYKEDTGYTVTSQQKSKQSVLDEADAIIGAP